MTDVAKQLEALATKKRRQYHQSTVEMVSKCGVQAEFRYVAGIRSRPKSFLMCGTATDKSVSTDLDCKISTGELEKEDVLLDVARDAIEHYPGKEELQPEDDEVGRSIEEIVASTKDKAVRLVKAHHGNIAPEIQPRQTARRFAINLDKWLRGRASEIHAQAEDAPTPWLKRALHQQARYLNVAARDGTDFVGEQDIVEEIDKQIIIRDTKTSKKSPSSDTAHESHQVERVCSCVLSRGQADSGGAETGLSRGPEGRHEDNDALDDARHAGHSKVPESPCAGDRQFREWDIPSGA
jgi:hypothetical protein